MNVNKCCITPEAAKANADTELFERIRRATPEQRAIIEAVLEGRLECKYGGWYGPPQDTPCPTCGGTKTIEAVDKHGDTLAACPTCHGTGRGQA